MNDWSNGSHCVPSLINKGRKGKVMRRAMKSTRNDNDENWTPDGITRLKGLRITGCKTCPSGKKRREGSGIPPER